IISVRDYGCDAERTPFFTMELLVGASPLLTACQGRPFAERAALLFQVAQALAYLHRRAVLHRDLKPPNILVVPSGDGPCVKVLDFGLAVLRKQEAVGGTLELAGTIAYMAPEVLHGGSPSES